VKARFALARASLRRPGAWALAIAAALFLYAATGFFAVPATSVAVTRSFGRVIDAAVPPGIHWFWPWPFGRADSVEVTRTFIMPVGYFLLPDGARKAFQPPSVASWLTGDTNIIELRARIDYRIADPVRFLFGTEAPAEMLRFGTGSAFTGAASALPVDDLLTSGRLALTQRVRATAQRVLDAWGVGLQILAVNLESVDPPGSVVVAFQDVQNARADRERQISEAETYANGVVPIARGQAEKMVNEALGFSDQRLNRARGDANRFAELAAEHRRAPALLERRLYLEMTERVLPRARRYVLEPGDDGSLPVRIVQ
jgi:membrane protease subunit HflK